MQFSDFIDNSQMLLHFGLKATTEEFIDLEAITPIEIPAYLKEDLKFIIANRGSFDLEFYACEFLISPFLKEAWKRNPKQNFLATRK